MRIALQLPEASHPRNANPSGLADYGDPPSNQGAPATALRANRASCPQRAESRAESIGFWIVPPRGDERRVLLRSFADQKQNFGTGWAEPKRPSACVVPELGEVRRDFCFHWPLAEGLQAPEARIWRDPGEPPLAAWVLL